MIAYTMVVLIFIGGGMTREKIRVDEKIEFESESLCMEAKGKLKSITGNNNTIDFVCIKTGDIPLRNSLISSNTGKIIGVPN